MLQCPEVGALQGRVCCARDAHFQSSRRQISYGAHAAAQVHEIREEEEQWHVAEDPADVRGKGSGVRWPRSDLCRMAAPRATAARERPRCTYAASTQCNHTYIHTYIHTQRCERRTMAGSHITGKDLATRED